jgi:hypothetical protein
VNRATRRVCEKWPKVKPNHFFFQNWHTAFTGEKFRTKFGLLLQFSNNLPRVNNRPIGGNQPNLVTLFVKENASAMIPVYVKNFFNFKLWSKMRIIKSTPGANPTIATYNATGSLVRFENNLFLLLKKRPCLLHRWRCSCRFRSRRIVSRSWWPDWANFRPMSECLLPAVTWKLQEYPTYLG